MNKPTHIHQLFNRLLESTISENELDELLMHIADSTAEAEVKSLMEDHWAEIEDKLSAFQQGTQSARQFSRIAQKTGLTRQTIQPVNTRPTPRIGQWLTIAASFMVLIATGWMVYNAIFHQSVDSVSEPEIARSFHGKQIVTLPDGSTVILNEESRLSFRENFGIENREVIFVGEGYFDIVHDPERPFIVHTGQVNTTVLGTAFNLIAYEDQSEILVTVERGEVAVGDQEKIYDHILPEEQLVINTRTLHVEKERVDLDRVLAWKENFLILDDVTIRIAAEMIAKRYGVAVSVENEEMKNCMINAAFLHGETLEQVLRVLCGVLQADFSVENQEVTIKGGRACI